MNAQQAFSDAVAMITARIAGQPLDDSLLVFLNENFPPGFAGKVSKTAGSVIASKVESSSAALLSRVLIPTVFPSTL